ncbi:MAG: carbohydrate ABC transporter permease [Actinocatenispora sp.]
MAGTLRRRRAEIPIVALLVVVAVTIVYPVVFVALTSLRSNTDYLRNPYGLPGAVSLSNFRTLLFNYGLAAAARNSIVVVGSSMLVTLVLAMLAGYALAKLPVPGKRLVSASLVSVMLVPGQVLIIPIYLMLSKVHLVGGLWGLLVVYVATSLPFAVFFLTTVFRGVPDSILEAARIDGAGFVRTLRSIVIPSSLPGIATLCVLQFLGMWNELIFAYILITDESKRLITPALASIGGKFVTDQPLVAAGLMVTALPPLLLLGFTSRFLIKGMTAGATR